MLFKKKKKGTLAAWRCHKVTTTALAGPQTPLGHPVTECLFTQRLENSRRKIFLCA